MGGWWSGEEEQANQRRREENQAEQRRQEDLRKKNEHVALGQKIGRIRINLMTKKPGQSNYFPQGVEVPNRLFISLFGEIAAGKSSLINSFNYIIEGLLNGQQRTQTAGQNFQGAHTMESLEVVLTKHLSVIDNPGIKCEKSADPAIREDVIKRMEGTYTNGTVTWQSVAPAHANEVDKKSFCSVMVFSAHHANVVRQYRSFIHYLRNWQGRFPLAVITHVDEVKDGAVRLALEAGGIGDIYEVANITSGNHGRTNLSPEHQLQLLQLLEKCFEDGDSIFLRRQEIESGE